MLTEIPEKKYQQQDDAQFGNTRNDFKLYMCLH